MNYYPFNISDFSYATRHLSIIEKAIYRELLDLYYDRESPLENNPEKLSKLICANDRLTDVERVLNEFFTLTENGWQNNTCDRIISEYHSKLETASRAGKASARARAKKHAIPSQSTTVERPLNDRATNQEPITKNQEPNKEKGEKRAIFIRPSLTDVQNQFVEKGFNPTDAHLQAYKFFNHYEANGWMVGKSKMKNWKAALSGWITRSKEYENAKRNKSKEIDFHSTGWSAGIELPSR